MLENDLISNKKVNVVIFASGAGTNAHELIKYFSSHSSIEVVLIVSNKENAGVLSIAKQNGLKSLVIKREEFNNEPFLSVLKSLEINFIVLAGFLLKVPGYLIDAFQNRIINIHPALLPSYGGKGMYGKYVHKAVIANKELMSGITIHLADNEYDHGKVLFQAMCKIEGGDEEKLVNNIHQLEHEHFAPIIEAYIKRYKTIIPEQSPGIIRIQ